MLHARGQVEIVGGTDGEIFEGVFDYRLMVDDLVRLSDRIYRLFG